VIVLEGFSGYKKEGHPVVTLGTFDGVHIGHAAIFKTMKEIAARSGEKTVVVTFRSHPRSVLNPDSRVPFLASLNYKLELIASHGIDVCIVIDFTREISQMSADEFTASVISGTLGASHAVIGHDHAFGKNREGGIDSLVALGNRFGFGVTQLDRLTISGETVSSSRIRSLLDAGDVTSVAECLGRYYSVCGIVVRGCARGRTLGFPTANLSPMNKDKCIPLEGVYASRFTDGTGKIFDSVTSVGTNPTFDGKFRTIETHLLDFDDDLYDQQVKVEFIGRIRGEMRFPAADDLKKQIADDCAQVRKILREAR
jgi:riboflavin kinase / FMN adenylyltransferase